MVDDSQAVTRAHSSKAQLSVVPKLDCASEPAEKFLNKSK